MTRPHGPPTPRYRHELGFRVAILLVLCTLTITFSASWEPYSPIGPNLLRNPDFAAGFDAWAVTPREAIGTGLVAVWNGTLTVAVSPDGAPNRVDIRQTRTLDGDRVLILSGEVSGRNVVPGTKPWGRARILLAPEDAAGQLRHDVPHTLASLEGTVPWKRFTRTFRIPEENDVIAVVIQMPNATGTLEVRSLSLHAARETPGYDLLRKSLIALWLLAVPWIAWPVLRSSIGRPGGSLVIGIACVILVGVLMPAELKYLLTPSWLLPEAEAPGPFRADLLPSAAAFRIELVSKGAVAYKAAHFALFALMGYVLRSRRPFRATLSCQFSLVSVFALATEAAQSLASGRGGSLADLLVDLAGLAAGMLLAAAAQRGSAALPGNAG